MTLRKTTRLPTVLIIWGVTTDCSVNPIDGATGRPSVDDEPAMLRSGVLASWPSADDVPRPERFSLASGLSWCRDRSLLISIAFALRGLKVPSRRSNLKPDVPPASCG